jgi:hypothetical protein
MHAIRASRPMCKLLCEIAVPVDVGLVAEGRDPVDIGVCWCRIPQRARGSSMNDKAQMGTLVFVSIRLSAFLFSTSWFFFGKRFYSL